MLKVMVIGAFSAALSTAIALARKNETLPAWALPSIQHPYAAQVFGIVVGYLLIMRLNTCLSRWDSGMMFVETMEAKWLDAYTGLMTFVHAVLISAKGGRQAGRPDFGPLVLSYIEADFFK